MLNGPAPAVISAHPNGTLESPASDRKVLAGRPRFASMAPASGAQTIADEQAWRQLLQTHGPAQAACYVAGDFAVALTLADGSVFMAVDRFATQTLCYRVEGQRIDFATRADTIAANRADLDPQAIFDYLYFHVIPSPRTVFCGVQRLPPGHYALFKAGHLTVAPYWKPNFAPVSQPSFAALRDEFNTLLRQSVRRQLDGSKPACFLSGGTDSSSVAGLITEIAGQPAECYSIGFHADGYDEMAYARLAAKHFGTRHHEYYVTPEDLIASIAHVAASFDQPFGNSSAVPAYYCASKAKQDGVSKLLAGDGGDELFGGNSRYATQRMFGWYQRVPIAFRRRLMEPFFSIDLISRTPGLKKGSGYIRQANTPLPERMQQFNLLRRLGFSQVLEPGFLAQVDPESVMAQQDAVWASAGRVSEIDKHLAYDWRYTLAENDLPKVVGATTLAGIEAGFPLLDDDLVAFSARLPAEYKLKGMHLRWFFKEALRGFLPDEIITKKKQGFGLPFGTWMVNHAGLKKLAVDSLKSIAERGIVRREFVREVLDVHLPSHPHYYGTIVWILMMLEHWLRAHAPDYRCQR
jgi:asparagine synthase (glutamine-hydrolysing)